MIIDMRLLVFVSCYAFSRLVCTSVGDSKQLPWSKFVDGRKHVDILIKMVLISNWLVDLLPANLEYLMCKEVTPMMSKLMCKWLDSECSLYGCKVYTIVDWCVLVFTELRIHIVRLKSLHHFRLYFPLMQPMPLSHYQNSW